MNIAQIETNIQKLVKPFKKDSFIYDLLKAYGIPKASVTRLQQGGLNLSKVEGEILWKKKLFFGVAYKQDLHVLIDAIRNDERIQKHDPRFIIVTDFKTLLAIDRKTSETLDIWLLEIAKHFDFFLPWAGIEKFRGQTEKDADVKAAYRMAKLFDELRRDNPTKTSEAVHNLNVFLSRILFCFFAEDTGIFTKGQFTNALSSHTQSDGSDLNEYLDKLFEVMNTEPKKRGKLPNYLDAFPYVNGGLFRNKHTAPVFSARSRKALLESGDLKWSDINPDIFGSMMQGVVVPEQRSGLGMHYTSIPNIMKVIEPLFLNELKDSLDAAKGNTRKLNALLERIWNLKIFDPACGSGNFLIVAYKEVRRLEMKIFAELNRIKKQQEVTYSNVSLNQFYGIEIDDFAHEIAILSLWLAEHQLNMEFFAEFGRTRPALPLKQMGNIVHGNATLMDWEIVCKKDKGAEVYLLGNPPYRGSTLQSAEQKQNLSEVFTGIRDYKNLDYVACWFLKGVKYIAKSNAQLAFVSTNSISQGEQVSLLWPHIINAGIEIGFAHQSFKWSNNAKGQAGVTCVIIGLRNKGDAKKLIYGESGIQQVTHISPYLTKGTNTIIYKRQLPISKLPTMTYGNKAVDGGHLILSSEEKEALLKFHPNSAKYLRKLIGSDEFINNLDRWCLWINDDELPDALSIRPIADRIKAVNTARLGSKDKGAQILAKRSHQFRDVRSAIKHCIVIPRVSSERRQYVVCGFLSNNEVVLDRAQVIYDSDYYVFGIISSKMHMVWTNQVTGRLETRLNYSSMLCYNNFPFPDINMSQKNELEVHSFNILQQREKYSERTLAYLYDPDTMPEGLKEAHMQNDLAIERCYRSKPFESDEERLEYLFKLYEEMIADEKSKGTLFEVDKKAKKKRK